jgi:hypothetical protein
MLAPASSGQVLRGNQSDALCSLARPSSFHARNANKETSVVPGVLGYCCANGRWIRGDTPQEKTAVCVRLFRF